MQLLPSCWVANTAPPRNSHHRYWLRFLPHPGCTPNQFSIPKRCGANLRRPSMLLSVPCHALQQSTCMKKETHSSRRNWLSARNAELNQYPEPPLKACCAVNAGDPTRLPAEYVLLALAASNATYCSSPAHALQDKAQTIKNLVCIVRVLIKPIITTNDSLFEHRPFWQK